MRAKEFIKEYAVVDKPAFKIRPVCPVCSGTGNVDNNDGTTKTCSRCKGAGTLNVSVDGKKSGYASDLDYQMNRGDMDTLWAVGKF